MARDRELQLALGIVAVLLLVVGGAGVWLLGSGDAPEDPDGETTLAVLEDTEEVKETLRTGESVPVGPSDPPPHRPDRPTDPTPPPDRPGPPAGWRAPAFRPLPDGARVNTVAEALALGEAHMDVGLTALLLAREASPELRVEPYLTRLDEMARAVLAKLPAGAGPEDVTEALAAQVHEVEKLTYKDGGPDGIDPHNAYLDRVLDDRTGYCLSLCVLYMALAERIGVPLRIVEIPEHVFLRYEGPGTRINFETTSGGQRISDATYRKRHPFPPAANAYYLVGRGPRVAIAHLLMSHGLILWKAGRSAEAERAFRASRAWDPDHLFAGYNLANAHLERGDHARARAGYEAFVARRPDLADGWLGLGRAALGAQDIEGARRALDKAEALTPQSVEVALTRAELAYRAGDWDRVIALTKSQPADRTDFGYLRARALSKAGRHAEAEAAWRGLVRVEPTRVEFQRKLAGTLIAAGKKDEAEKVLRRMLRAQPTEVFALATLGSLRFGAGDAAEAVKLLRRALTHATAAGADTDDANLGVLYNNLGRALIATKDTEGAARTAVAGLRRLPRSQRLAHLAGMIYLNHLRDPAAARRYLQRYIKLGGTDAAVRRWLRENPE